jgi:TatD DNase family protein
VERALVILEAGNTKEAAQAERVASLWPEVRFSIGVHPHQALQFAGDPEAAATLVREQVAATPLARAIGEIGLDYHYDFSPRDVQHAVFRAQVRLARELGRPVVIHTREADEDTLAILAEEGGGEVRGVLHCFTGNDARRRRAALRLFVSLAGIVTFRSQISARRRGACRSMARRDRQTFSRRCPTAKRNEPACVARAPAALAGCGRPATWRAHHRHFTLFRP